MACGYSFLSVYCDYGRGVVGVFLGSCEGREMRAEMPIPEGASQFQPTAEQVLDLVDRAVGNHRCGQSAF